MKKVLLDENLNFYRVNLHCHSTLSDGKKTPEEIKEFYKAHGYSAVAFTDHDVFINHNDLTDDSFVALNGIEYGPADPNPWNSGLTKCCHICMVAEDPENRSDPFYRERFYAQDKIKPWLDRTDNDPSKPIPPMDYDGEVLSNMMKYGREKGFFVTYNHPTWSLETYPQYSKYSGMNAMEIVNFGCVVEGYDDDNGHCYDDLLNLGNRIYAIATDDNHNHQPDESPRCDSFGGATVIAATELSYVALMKALKEGSFYAMSGSSQHVGPEIKSIVWEDGKVIIKTSPVRTIQLITGTRGCRVAHANKGESLTEATLTPRDGEIWFRVVVTDHEGYKSYSNAYFVDEIK